MLLLSCFDQIDGKFDFINVTIHGCGGDVQMGVNDYDAPTLILLLEPP